MIDDKLKRFLVVSGLGLSLSASAAVLYFLLKSDDENKRLNPNIVSGSHQTMIKISVPNNSVGAIIGRQGAVIKDLQNKTNTRIRFDDKGSVEDADRIIIIRGAPEDAQEAETVIRKLIVDLPEIFTEEIFIPVRACGRIIGKNGGNIRQMSYASQAKITVDRSGNDRDPDDVRRVSIHGTRDQIIMAVNMIDEKLAEDEAFRQKIEISASGRPMRYRSKPLSIQPADENGSKDSQLERMQEKLISTAADGFIEVYISAVNTVGQFWVQLIGIKAIELDKLVEDMTSFYNNLHNQDTLSVTEVKIGSIVAAPFLPDKSWYRARVVSIEDDDYDPLQSKVSVHYVDFGDSAVLQLHSLCLMKEEFMVLPFQAMECQLANVKPADGDQWNEESTDMFEVLTYSAQWKTIMAKPQCKVNKDSGHSVIAVELVDTNRPKDINVAEELVKRKLAISDKL